MTREEMSTRKDRSVFVHTASKSKNVNIKPRICRGGFRF